MCYQINVDTAAIEYLRACVLVTLKSRKTGRPGGTDKNHKQTPNLFACACVRARLA